MGITKDDITCKRATVKRSIKERTKPFVKKEMEDDEAETTNKKQRQQMGITKDDITGKRATVKRSINERTKPFVQKEMKEDGMNKSKVNYQLQGVNSRTLGQHLEYMDTKTP